MLYACSECGQTFWGFEQFKPQQCPKCGKCSVREALEHEQIAYELEQATSWRISHRKEA